jgi:hypothetical protein
MPAVAGAGSAPFQTGQLLPRLPGHNAGLSAGSCGPPALWYLYGILDHLHPLLYGILGIFLWGGHTG